MRVHHLEMTAFGPFAGTQAVDFEPLNAAGVFLLTGQTGAGKTSILDAICFGLFGQVPGVRDRAKTYRSQHAARDVVPLVVLEVTLQGRRLRLTRRPGWSRPSRRARSGHVEEKARALAEELVDGEWMPRSSRVDEVGHLVSSLLGLNRDQFCQVVMLPQGEFQVFLRSGGRERQHILETLFGTQRFQAVERWLAEHRRVQARRCRAHEETIDRLLARLHEVCAPVPADVLPAADGDHRAMLTAARLLVEVGAGAVTSAAEITETATARAKLTDHALDEGRTLADRRERHLEARRHHDALLAVQDVVAARQRRVRLARAAEPLLPLATLVSEAEQTLERARTDVCAAVAQVATISTVAVASSTIGESMTSDEASRLTRRLGQRISRLEALVDLDSELDDLTAGIADSARSRLALVATVDGLTADAARVPGQLADLRARIDGASLTIRRGADADPRRRRAAQARAAAAEVAAFDQSVARIDAAISAARESATSAVEVWLESRERYLADLAAELATLLAEDDPCPVCGSLTHPAPAATARSHVTSHQEAGLLEAATVAREVLSRLKEESVATLSDRCDAVVRAGGLDEQEAAAALELAAADLHAAANASTAHTALTGELRTLLVEADGRAAALESASTELTRTEERLAVWQRRLDVVTFELVSGLGEGWRVHDALALAADDLERCRGLEEALRSRDDATRLLKLSRGRLAAALEGSELEASEELTAAHLSQADIAHEEALNRAHDVDLATWSRVLTDPALLTATDAPPPDLARLESEAAEAAAAGQSATARSTFVEHRQSRLEELVLELDRLVAELVPLRAARELSDDLAGLCAGTSTDNATRTALSHYVLATRLTQVVSAANLRLDSIGSGRYQLEHTMARGAGDTRGGLGLVVRDTYTDQGRDPATLSGGETFYVSLSLALGLADVVTAEAGGSELSTLFVDEGFGSLDDDTRDEVLDEIDALRSGGRTVGLVSHLAELRARCPTQLHVVATPAGSRCLPVTGT